MSAARDRGVVEGRRAAARGGAETKVTPGARRGGEQKGSTPDARPPALPYLCGAGSHAGKAAAVALSRTPAPRRPRPCRPHPEGHSTPTPRPRLASGYRSESRAGACLEVGGAWRPSAPCTRALLKSQSAVFRGLKSPGTRWGAGRRRRGGGSLTRPSLPATHTRTRSCSRPGEPGCV